MVVSSVVNGASFQPVIVPGSWATIQGTNLSSATGTWDVVDGKLPTTVDGVSVTVGGQSAFVDLCKRRSNQFRSSRGACGLATSGCAESFWN
jgi:hypothetical protein